MFRQRFITSVILIPLILFIIYFANPTWLEALVVFLTLCCGYEWLQLIPIKSLENVEGNCKYALTFKIIFLLSLIVCIYLCFKWLAVWLWIGIILWAMIFFALITFPTSQVFWGYRSIVMTFALILLPLFYNSLINVYFSTILNGKHLIVYLLCLVWAADIGAYLFGKQFGRHKLIPLVSPGKTLEGTAGGFLSVILVSIISYLIFHPASFLLWLMIGLGIGFISMVGDLFISMLKRRCLLKDTGHIIPGHGGILDRLDSLIAAAPWFYFSLKYVC